jgi:hypothetical protein
MVSINQQQLRWTFEEIILGLYDRFIHPSTMQDARKAFFAAKYTGKKGIQGFYDTLLEYAHNMAVYPNDYLIMETFLKGIPESIRKSIITDGLSPKVNMIDDFVAQAKLYKYLKKTLNYYNHLIMGRVTTDTKEPSPSHTRKNRMILAKQPDRKLEHGPRPNADDKVRLAGERSPPTPLNMDAEKARAILDFICYNCGEKGHKSRDCKKPHKPKIHLWAAHTETPYRPNDGRNTLREDEDAHPRESEKENGGESTEELVEVEVPENSYSNDFYERDSTLDYMALMHIGTMEPKTQKRNLFKEEPARDERPIRM